MAKRANPHRADELAQQVAELRQRVVRLQRFHSRALATSNVRNHTLKQTTKSYDLEGG